MTYNQRIEMEKIANGQVPYPSPVSVERALALIALELDEIVRTIQKQGWIEGGSHAKT